MNTKEIKEYLIEDVDRVVKVLELFGFHHFSIHEGEETRISCALPDGDNSTSVNIYINDYINGIVFTRGSFKGDIFGIIEEFTNYSFKEIILNVRHLFGLQGGSKPIKANSYDSFIKRSGWDYYIKRNKQKKRLYNGNELFDETILNKYVPLHTKEIVQEGISPSVCKQFNIMTNVNDDRLLFPHYDWEHYDKIVGIQARKNNMDTYTAKQLDIPKYINYIKGYKKEHNLYGWSHNHENIIEQRQLIMFEGEKSVLKEATYNKGLGLGVSVGSHAISDAQINFIIKNTPEDTEVIIAFDNDVFKDEEDFTRLQESIRKLCKYRKVTYVEDFSNRLLSGTDSPVDKGVKIWKALLSMRREFVYGEID